MGRTIPSFRIALGMEKEDWKPFRNALGKSDRKKFDEMFDIPKSYISACSNSVQYVRLHPILISILLHHYKQLKGCMTQVEQIESRVKEEEKDLLLVISPLLQQEQMREEEQQTEEQQHAATNSGTLDSYFL
jgi:hypothetical protein